MVPRIGDGRGLGVSSLTWSAAQAWESFALLIALTSAGFVTALSDRTSVGGPFPAGFSASILPGLPAHLAGEMPSLREGDRYFWGCAFTAQQLHPAVFPVPEPVASELVSAEQVPQAGSSQTTPASSRSGAYEHSLPSPAPGT
jgi:hypothetical protein